MIDPDHPMESGARTYLFPILNRGTGYKLATMLGIDVGSTTVKIVGVDAASNPTWHFIDQADPPLQSPRSSRS